MVYDAYNGRIVLFGGYDASGEYADMWSYDVADNSWTQIKASGAGPSARNPSMVYDGETDTIILFGGSLQGGALAPWCLQNEVTNGDHSFGNAADTDIACLGDLYPYAIAG